VAYPYNDIFNIPERILLNRRITKTFFQKNYDLTANEKKLLNNTIQNIWWLTSIKPKDANIPAFVNGRYKYEEIQIIKCSVPDNQLDKTGKRCVELIQKYIPYQIILVVEDDFEFVINACDKRVNQSETSKRTIDQYFYTAPISKLYKNEAALSFFKSIDFTALDKTNLETTYKAYIDAIVQFQSALITGEFKKKDKERIEKDMVSLQTIENLEQEITSLKNQLKSEKQLNHKVDFNLEIQSRRKEIRNIKKKLSI
jgi:hypothetical protein